MFFHVEKGFSDVHEFWLSIRSCLPRILTTFQALIRLGLLDIEVDKSCPGVHSSSENANHSHWPYMHRTMLFLSIFCQLIYI